MKTGKERFAKRGEVWLVTLAPTIGGEISKTRPAMVISNDRGNEFSSTVTVLPLTSKIGKVYPFETLLPPGSADLLHASKVKCNQIRTVDKQRLIKFIGKLEPGIMKQIERSLLLHLDIELPRYQPLLDE